MNAHRSGYAETMGWFAQAQVYRILERLAEIAGAAVLVSPLGTPVASGCRLRTDLDLLGLARLAALGSAPLLTVSLDLTALDLRPIKLGGGWCCVVTLDRGWMNEATAEEAVVSFRANGGAELLTDLVMCRIRGDGAPPPPSGSGPRGSPAEDVAGFAWPGED